MAKQDSTAVATKQAAGALANYDYGELSGAGWENTSRDDFAIPFIGILQSGSPQVKKKDPQYIDGAEEGMLINTVSESVISGNEGLCFIPCHTEQVYVEWVPRAAGGGFVGIHDVDSEIVAQARENGSFGELKRGVNELVQTFYMYGLIVPTAGADNPDVTPEPAVIAFTSTKIGRYKKIMTRLRTFKNGKLPLFAYRLHVQTFHDSNAKGEFWNFNIGPWGGDIEKCLIPPQLNGQTHPLLTAGHEFRQAVLSGMARAAHESLSNGGGGSDAGEEAPF